MRLQLTTVGSRSIGVEVEPSQLSKGGVTLWLRSLDGGDRALTLTADEARRLMADVASALEVVET
jgi:hypothetical protein